MDKIQSLICAQILRLVYNYCTSVHQNATAAGRNIIAPKITKKGGGSGTAPSGNKCNYFFKPINWISITIEVEC